MVVSRYVKRYRTLYLSPKFFAAQELRAVLALLAQQSPKYEDLRVEWVERVRQRDSIIAETRERNRKKNAKRAKASYWHRKRT